MRVCGGSISAVMVLLLLIVLPPRQALAQERPGLRLPMTVFGAAAAGDWATTYHALKNYQVREANPLLRPFDHRPGKMVGLGAAIDVGLATGWNYSVGRSHPRIAATGLWAATAFRAYLAIHNLRSERRSARR